MKQSKEEFIEEQFDLACETFDSRVYPKEDGIMCKIHDAFGSRKSKHHNCIGCNLDDSTHHVFMFLTNSSGYQDLHLAFTTYILLLYILVEKMETIFEIIGLPESYRLRHFQIFKKTKKWANFIKHPKAFVLCHHPQYVLENYKGWNKKTQKDKIIIDTEFVFKYYSGDTYKNELFKILTNKSNIVVEVPNIKKLTDDFIDGLERFVQLIENNEVYREILNDKATFENYFTEETDNLDK
jgi:hypothetical protein